jgi:hypothetical protein
VESIRASEMLQCNRYPGLDANEIIRLTSAIGQKQPVGESSSKPTLTPLVFLFVLSGT